MRGTTAEPRPLISGIRLNSLVVEKCVDYLLKVLVLLLKLALRQFAFRDNARGHGCARRPSSSASSARCSPRGVSLRILQWYA